MSKQQDSVSRGVVVLLDQFTKATANKIAFDAISKKALVINDIREVDENCRGLKLVVFEPAFLVVVTKEIVDQIAKEFNVTTIGVYLNDEMKNVLGDSAQMLQCKHDDISWNLLYGIIQADTAILEPYQKGLAAIDEFKAVKSKLPEDLIEYFNRFKGTYLTLLEQARELAVRNGELQDIIRVQESIGQRSIRGIRELKQLLDSTADRMRGYEAILAETYDKTFSGFYPERPTVLYIKSVSHVAGIEILLSVLYTVLTTQYRLSCKVIKLVDHSNSRDISYIPDSYVPISDTYNTAQILDNEFVVKLGAYNLMFDLLLMNKSGLDFIIVHDMRCAMHDALDPALIDLKIHEVSADYAALEEYTEVLSDLGKNVPFYWSYQECKKYLGSGVTRLANHPTIGKILSRLL